MLKEFVACRPKWLLHTQKSYPGHVFFMKMLLILPMFHGKTLSLSGDFEIIDPGRRMYIYTFPPFMDELLSEKRQLMKWVGIFHVGIF